MRRLSLALAVCGSLVASQAAQAFFCFNSGTGNRSYARSLAYPLAYPPAAYRLPPIIQPRPAAQRAATPHLVRPPPSQNWRPQHQRLGNY